MSDKVLVHVEVSQLTTQLLVYNKGISMVIAYHMYIVQSATKEVAVKWLHCVVATVYFMH